MIGPKKLSTIREELRQRIVGDRRGSHSLAGSTNDRPGPPGPSRRRRERGPAFTAAIPRSAGTTKTEKPTSRCEQVTAHDREGLPSTRLPERHHRPIVRRANSRPSIL